MWPSMSTSNTAENVYSAVPTPTRIKTMVKVLLARPQWARGSEPHRGDGRDGLVEGIEEVESEQQVSRRAGHEHERQGYEANPHPPKWVTHRVHHA